METTDIQPKAMESRNRQIDLALKLIRRVGLENAIEHCKENHWHGTLTYVRKLGVSQSKFYSS